MEQWSWLKINIIELMLQCNLMLQFVKQITWGIFTFNVVDFMVFDIMGNTVTWYDV